MLLFYIVCLCGIVSCGEFGLYDSDESKVIARVADSELRESAIADIYYGVLSAEDSSKLRETAINSWIEEQIKLNAAQQVISNDVSRELIQEMVEQYRKNLLSYTFEQIYLEKNLDTSITQNEIKEYYNRNSSNFKLISPLVKAVVVRLPLELRQSKKLEQMFTKGKEQDMVDFLNICKKNNYKVNDFSEQWVEFSTVLQTIPFKRADYDDFLKSKKIYEIRDDQFHYLMRIEECLFTGEASPLEREKNTIVRILRNQRRDELLREFNDSLIRSAYLNQLVMIEDTTLSDELVIAKKDTLKVVDPTLQNRAIGGALKTTSIKTEKQKTEN